MTEMGVGTLISYGDQTAFGKASVDTPVVIDTAIGGIQDGVQLVQHQVWNVLEGIGSQLPYEHRGGRIESGMTFNINVRDTCYQDFIKFILGDTGYAFKDEVDYFSLVVQVPQRDLSSKFYLVGSAGINSLTFTGESGKTLMMNVELLSQYIERASASNFTAFYTANVADPAAPGAASPVSVVGSEIKYSHGAGDPTTPLVNVSKWILKLTRNLARSDYTVVSNGGNNYLVPGGYDHGRFDATLDLEFILPAGDTWEPIIMVGDVVAVGTARCNFAVTVGTLTVTLTNGRYSNDIAPIVRGVRTMSLKAGPFVTVSVA